MNIKTYISKIKEILNKPFPFDYSLKMNIRYSLVFGMFVAAFLIIFRPFGINQEEPVSKLFWLLSGYGALTSLIMFVNSTLLSIMFLKLRSEADWKVKHELLFTICTILSIAVANSIYNSLTEGFPITLSHIFDFTYQTFLVGFLPLMIAVLIVYNRKLKKNLAEARRLNEDFYPEKQNNTSAKINIQSEVGKDSLSINVCNLYFIKSASNYVEIFYSDESAIKSKLIRTSLKKVEDLLAGFKFVFKCHRTYLVNLEKVKSISGNSQGYLLLFEDSEYSVPVARSSSKELKERLLK